MISYTLKMRRLSLRSLSMVLLISFISTPAFSQEITDSSGDVLTQILNEVKTVSSTLYTYYGDQTNPKDLRPASPDLAALNLQDRGIVQSTDNQAFRIANNYHDSNIDMQPYPPSATWQAIENILRTPPTKDDGPVSVQSVQQYMSGLGISPPYAQPQSGGIFSGPSSEQNTPNASDQSLNLDSLLQPLALQSQTDTSDLVKALSFIRFSSGQAIPAKLVSSSQFALMKKTPDQLNEYMVTLRNYAALSSVGISNFNSMLAKREIPQGQTKSELQFEHDLASRRFGDGQSDSDWRKRMEAAPPVVIQREMLYLLAEMNYQLYLNRMELERILATDSAMQLHQLQTDAKSQLEQIASSSKPSP